MLTHVDSTSLVLLLYHCNKSLELHSTVASTRRSCQMRKAFDMFKICAILIEHLAEVGSKTRCGIAFEHHLIEVNQTSLLHDEADIAPGYMNHSMSTSAFDVDLLV